MSVTAYTLTVKRAVIPGTNKTIMSFLTSSTGDGSGGTVSAAVDVIPYLPQNCVVTILDCGFYNDDTGGRAQHLGTDTTGWEVLPHANLVESNSGSELISGGATAFYYSKIENSPYNFPLYVGKPLASSVNFTYSSATNTNTKHYYGWWRLLVDTLN